VSGDKLSLVNVYLEKVGGDTSTVDDVLGSGIFDQIWRTSNDGIVGGLDV
jgi:hypothetical protein